MPSADLNDQFERYLGLALAGETRQGTRIALGMIDAGTTVEDVVAGLLAQTQRVVGERWHQNRCSVADEHLATAVTASALEAISDHHEPVRVVGQVAVACAEGDWHALPARMFCELLRTRGWDVWFLGASTPSDDLGAMLARRRPDALVVSSAVPTSFPGVHRLVVSAHDEGVPVLAGGGAFGIDSSRAERLGADGWAGDIEGAATVLSGWIEATPLLRLSVEPIPTTALLSRSAGRLADQVALSLVETGAVTDVGERTMSHLRHDLALSIEFLAAAVLVDDPTVFTDHVGWVDVHLAARGIPAGVLEGHLAALHRRVAPLDPTAAEVLGRAVAVIGHARSAHPHFVPV